MEFHPFPEAKGGPRQKCQTAKLLFLLQNGAIAELGERLNGIQEVGGSTPLAFTNFPEQYQ